jgi:hypothetical protein
MVDVQQRIAGDEDGHVGVTRLLVNGEKLFFHARADHKTIGRQPLQLVWRQSTNGTVHVAQVGGDGIMEDGRGSVYGRFPERGKSGHLWQG